MGPAEAERGSVAVQGVQQEADGQAGEVLLEPGQEAGERLEFAILFVPIIALSLARDVLDEFAPRCFCP